MLPRTRPSRPAAPARAAAAARRRAAVVLTLILAVLLPSAPASADPGDIGVMGPASAGVLDATSSWDLVESGFGLDQVDTLTGTLMAPDSTMAMSTDLAAAVDMAATSQMAFDAAELARQAQAEALRKRLAAQGTANGGLKPGSVPSPYDVILTEAIGTCPGLPIGIVAAQIAQESRWNPRAVSPVGAQGLSQFMPGTWTSEGVDGNGDGRKDPFDPTDAIYSAVSFDCKLLEAVKGLGYGGDPIELMLASYNAGLGAVKKYKGIPPYAETQNYVKKITASAADFTDTSSAQSEVGADGCPTSSPANTLRKGAEAIGAGTLCARSVAAARTPQAAKAIQYLFAHLGQPYSQARRNQEGYYDCSSYLSRAYQSAGVNIAPPGKNAQTTATIRAARWAIPVSQADMRPGDFIFPFAGHVGMVLADGWMIHTNQDGDVSHVTRAYTSPYLILRLDPSKV